jgi:acetylornithine deacetylase
LLTLSYARKDLNVLSLLKKEEIVDLACELVKQPSLTNKEGPAVDFMSDWYEDNGFDEVIIQKVQPGRRQVIGVINGDGSGKSMMYNGHLDIDPITEDWEWDPFEPKVDGNRLWGAGIHNMKSGDAAFLQAALAIKRSGAKLRGDLICATVVGELQGGVGTVHMLNEGVWADYAIVPEPYGIDNILTKCVGVHDFAINVIGKSEHISRMEEAVDAIKKMRVVLDKIDEMKFDARDPDLPGAPRWVAGSIIGGRNREYDLAGPYNIPDFCTVIVDFRYPPGYTIEEINERFIEILEEIALEDSEFRYEFEYPVNPRFRVGGTVMPPMGVDPNAEIVQMLRENHKEVTGNYPSSVGAVIPRSYCGNDTAHLAQAGIECCLYGPRGYPENVEKHVRIDEMVICAKSLALTGIQVLTK